MHGKKLLMVIIIKRKEVKSTKQKGYQGVQNWLATLMIYYPSLSARPTLIETHPFQIYENWKFLTRVFVNKVAGLVAGALPPHSRSSNFFRICMNIM